MLLYLYVHGGDHHGAIVILVLRKCAFDFNGFGIGLMSEIEWKRPFAEAVSFLYVIVYIVDGHISSNFSCLTDDNTTAMPRWHHFIATKSNTSRSSYGWPQHLVAIQFSLIHARIA